MYTALSYEGKVCTGKTTCLTAIMKEKNVSVTCKEWALNGDKYEAIETDQCLLVLALLTNPVLLKINPNSQACIFCSYKPFNLLGLNF